MALVSDWCNWCHIIEIGHVAVCLLCHVKVMSLCRSMAREAACYVLIGWLPVVLLRSSGGYNTQDRIAFIMAPKVKRQKVENSNDMNLRDAFKAAAKASPPTADVNDLDTWDFGTWREEVTRDSKSYYSKRKDKWWQELFETVLACKKHSLIGSFEAMEGIANSFWTTNPKELSHKFQQYVKAQGGIGIGEDSKAKPERDEPEIEDDPMQGDEAAAAASEVAAPAEVADLAEAAVSGTLPAASVSEEVPVAAEGVSEALPAETLPEVAAPAEVADLAEAAVSGTLPAASVSEEVPVAAEGGLRSFAGRDVARSCCSS